MKANELMIGDLIRDNYGNAAQVNIINAWSDLNVVGIEILEGPQEGITIDCPIDGLEPIPLTPEILEKNGFCKPLDAGDGTLICGMTVGPYKLTFQSIFGLPILTIENVVDNDNNHTCLVLKDEIYNVHELQHALRLCGIEKDIVLCE